MYALVCKLNGRIYVGSSRQFKKRRGHHLTSLKRGKHENAGMQADYAQCGPSGFAFSIIQDVVFPSELLAEEKRIIAELAPRADLYNEALVPHQPVQYTPSNELDQWLTKSHAARILNISRGTLDKWIESNRLPEPMRIGTQAFMPRDAIFQLRKRRIAQKKQRTPR